MGQKLFVSPIILYVQICSVPLEVRETLVRELEAGELVVQSVNHTVSSGRYSIDAVLEGQNEKEKNNKV